MRYAFIRRHRSVWPIRIQCCVLKVSVAGYHEHFGRQARRVWLAAGVAGTSGLGACRNEKGDMRNENRVNRIGEAVAWHFSTGGARRAVGSRLMST